MIDFLCQIKTLLLNMLEIPDFPGFLATQWLKTLTLFFAMLLLLTFMNVCTQIFKDSKNLLFYSKLNQKN